MSNRGNACAMVSLLQQSAKDAGLPNDAEFACVFRSYVEWGSRLAVENSQINAKSPDHMAMSHWDWMTAAGPPGSCISVLAPRLRNGSMPCDGAWPQERVAVFARWIATGKPERCPPRSVHPLAVGRLPHSLSPVMLFRGIELLARQKQRGANRARRLNRSTGQRHYTK
jgi:hypothetical protein